MCDTWLACPEMVRSGNDRMYFTRKCGAPAEISHTEIVESTDGPVVHVKTRCAAGHPLFCPLEMFA